MMISGPTIHQQLMDAYRQTQTELENERRRILDAREQRNRIDHRREEALQRLAEHYLPELTSETVQQMWGEAKQAIEQVLDRKQQHCDRLQSELAELIAKRESHDQVLVSINTELDQAIEQQQALVAQTSQRLQQDPTFVQLADRAAVAETALERAEANLQEIDQDAARKLPAYEDSALFDYLHRRGYGTPMYRSRGFTRRMDRWVSRLIDYPKAKQGYEFLRRTPDQMRQIIAEDRQALDTVMDELERRRDEVAKELGLPDQITRCQQIEQRRDEQLHALDQILVQTDQCEQQITSVEDPCGPHYRQAIELFRQMLEKTDSNDLKRRAQATLEVTDDQIVASLLGAETEISRLDQAASECRAAVMKVQAFLEELGQLIQRFRAAGFDSSRSQFTTSLDLYDALQQARRSGDLDELWQRLRQNQRWGPTAIDQLTEVATHPMTQVLIGAMAHAVGGALAQQARRAGHRRYPRNSQWGGLWSGDSSSGFDWRR